MTAPWNGWPAAPERDGWHLLALPGQGPQPARWLAREGFWRDPPGWGGAIGVTIVVRERMSYHGPCPPPDHANAG